MTREVQKNLVFAIETDFWQKKLHFLTKNDIFDNKKAPAASRQPREIVFFLEKRYFGKKQKTACGKPPARGKRFWSSPTREPLVLSNKGAIGSPQQGSHWFTPTKEPLVHRNKGATPSGEKHQKHKNLHKTVIHRTFRANPIEQLRQNP